MEHETEYDKVKGKSIYMANIVLKKNCLINYSTPSFLKLWVTTQWLVPSKFSVDR